MPSTKRQLLLQIISNQHIIMQQLEKAYKKPKFPQPVSTHKVPDFK